MSDVAKSREYAMTSRIHQMNDELGQVRPPDWRESRPTFIDPKSMTDQSCKDECDINMIMRKYEKTKTVTHLNTYEGEYGNFIGAADYHAAQNMMASANQMFSSLPSKIRDRFNNNPAEFLAFVEDDKNESELVSMGLAKARPDPIPQGAGGGEPPADAGA